MKIGKKRIYSGETIDSGFGPSLASGDLVIVAGLQVGDWIYVRPKGCVWIFSVHKSDLKKYKKNKDTANQLSISESLSSPKKSKDRYKIVDASDNLDQSKLSIYYVGEEEDFYVPVCECESMHAANKVVEALGAFDDVVFFGGGK
jgi:hypothetical protein